jgi:hypothetical protein
VQTEVIQDATFAEANLNSLVVPIIGLIISIDGSATNDVLGFQSQLVVRQVWHQELQGGLQVRNPSVLVPSVLCQ